MKYPIFLDIMILTLDLYSTYSHVLLFEIYRFAMICKTPHKHSYNNFYVSYIPALNE